MEKEPLSDFKPVILVEKEPLSDFKPVILVLNEPLSDFRPVIFVEKEPLSFFRFVTLVEKEPLSDFKPVILVEKDPLSFFRFTILFEKELLSNLILSSKLELTKPKAPDMSEDICVELLIAPSNIPWNFLAIIFLLELILLEAVIDVVNIPSEPPIPDETSPVDETPKFVDTIVKLSSPVSIVKGLLPST